MLRLPPILQLSSDVGGIVERMRRLQDALFKALREFYDGPPFLGTDVWWDDVRVPVTATTRLGAADPVFTRFVRDALGTSQGVYSQAFAHNVEQELFFVAQAPHGLFEFTDWEPHVHFSPADTRAGNIILGCEYTVASPKTLFPASRIITASIAAAQQFPYHDIVDLPTIPGDGLKISALLIGRVFRDATATGDTYPGDCFLHDIDFHVRLNSMGSRQEFIK